MAVARFCTLKAIPFVDREAMQLGSRAKVNQYVNLHEIGAPFPASLIGSARVLAENYTAHGFSFPFIMKASQGSRGQDNFLVKDEAQLREIANAQPGVTFVLQTFIPNDGDWRVVVMGDQVKMIIGRTAQGETHLNNTSQGGAAEVLPLDALPAEVLEQCVLAAQFYGRDIAGVDVVRSTADGQYYFFEVNRSPQIEHASFEAEKAGHLADYLRTLAS
jgi:glutathione synthase/RimK-type ligase-like ATP-grasp enzyme